MNKILSTLFFILAIYLTYINASQINNCFISEVSTKKAKLIGLWKNPSLGTILNLFNDSDQLILERYQYTPISIILEQEAISLSEKDLESIQISKNNDLIIGEQIFVKMDKLPIASYAHSDNPVENFNVFTETFKQFYAFFEARNIDWKEITDQFRPKVSDDTTEDQLFQIFKQMISMTKDNHVALAKSFEENSEQYFQFNLPPSFEKQLIEDKSLLSANSNLNLSDYIDVITKEALSNILDHYLIDSQKDPSNKIIWGKLSQNPSIGYLNMGSMEYDSVELEPILDSIIDYFNENKISALIFDVRFNQGGDDQISFQLAKRFADKSHLIFTSQNYYNSGTLTPKKQCYINPENKQIWDPTLPKVLLTSVITASAAESFVLILSKFPNLTRIGESTMGILSDQFARKLPNGWWITLSNQIRLTPEGISYETTGIPVHINADFPFLKYSSAKEDPGIEAAYKFLNLH